MATAVVSALLKIPVRKDIAMTGEITLRGRVLQIGGLKEKLLAAHRGKIKEVLIPIDNKQDLKEIPKRILKELKVSTVEHMDEVLEKALIIPPDHPFFKKKGEKKEEESLPQVAKKKRNNIPAVVVPH